MPPNAVLPGSRTAIALSCASLVVTALVSCTPTATENNLGSLECVIPSQFIADGGPGKDGIPALTNPLMVNASAPGAAYLRDDDRVIGLQIDSEFIAIPLNIGWWHEVVNLSRGSLRLSVTHCPLTGSSLAFDRSAVGGAEFGVSGLLFMNNLMLYDRTGSSSLWPQMARGARCGGRSGTALPLYPSVEMSWSGWKTLHPETGVVSAATGFARNYQSYPYGDYATPTNPALLAPSPQLDPRRAPKERVLGIVLDGQGSVALPFASLRERGVLTAIHLTMGDDAIVVFWDGAKESAAAFTPAAGTDALTFEVVDGALRDRQTGSVWSADGMALSGPLTGQRLSHVADSFVAYWFAWAAFYPDTQLWTAP